MRGANYAYLVREARKEKIFVTTKNGFFGDHETKQVINRRAIDYWCVMTDEDSELCNREIEKLSELIEKFPKLLTVNLPYPPSSNKIGEK